MKIIKKINTSAAIGIDSSGKEVVVLGKGIGFPEVPYELNDLSKIDRTFYGVDSSFIPFIVGLPTDILDACAEIVETAEIELDTRLNPNLAVTLADHISFAVEKMKNGYETTSIISYDLAHLYSKEYQMAQSAIDILANKTGIFLPDEEANCITMHFINAETETPNLREVIKSTKIISEITKIVEKSLGIVIDKDSYNYNRFALHLRYLIQRLNEKREPVEYSKAMIVNLSKDHPEVYSCANKISNYLSKTWNMQCGEDELLYLMLHIIRVKNR